jgi:hypothetical protein
MTTNPTKNTSDPAYLKSLARAYTETGIRTLGGWANGDNTEPDIRIRAIGMLLDRGWGKPKQQVEHTGEDGGALEIIVRTIIEERKK